MCSVTFWPNPGGYLLGMNRDENRARVAGLPPRQFEAGGRHVVHPGEPAGGTWIALNDRGATFALINWYAIPASTVGLRVSRGTVVLAVRAAGDSRAAAGILAGMALTGVWAFRLIGFFPGERSVREWRWNQRNLERIDHDWVPGQWLSSGYDEPGAQRVRSAVFARRRIEPDAGRRAWLRRLHGSHDPDRGPYSICMHREAAETVSYTEVEAGPDALTMRYLPGAPCGLGDREMDGIELRPSRE